MRRIIALASAILLASTCFITKAAVTSAVAAETCFDHPDLSFVVEKNSTISVPFTKFPAPTPKPSNTPTTAPIIGVPIGASNVHGSISFELNGEDYDVKVSTPKPMPSLKAKAPNPAGAQPASSPTPSIEMKGLENTLTAVSFAPGIATAAIPSPTPVTSPSAKNTDSSTRSLLVSVTGVREGVARIEVSSGQVCDVAVIKVIPPEKTRFVVTAGLGGSRVSESTFTTASTTSSMPNTIFQTEKSDNQLFLPILASYRLTDFPALSNIYVSGGVATAGGNFRQLYGISFGDGDFLVTAGLHSDEVMYLSPNYKVGSEFTPGTPLTYSSRTTRLFAALTFSFCNIGSVFGAVFGSTSVGSSCTSAAATTSSSSSSSK